MDEQTKIIRRKSNRSQKKKPAKRRFRLGRFLWRLTLTLFLIFLTVAVIGGGAGIGFVAAVLNELPPIEEIGQPKPRLTSFVYSSNGEVIAELHRSENRIPVSLDEIPPIVQDAFVACEDHRFWEHRGADPIGIIRAFWVNLQAGTIVEGASTITMQVVKNAYTSFEETYRRKLQDTLLAFQMERRFTKSEILEMYLNLAFFGHDAYGIQAAAQTYFGKDVQDLTLPEGALLAGLLKGGNEYSPYHNYDGAISRQRLVLDQMARYEFITEAEAEQAKNVELQFVGLRDHYESFQAPHFVDHVIRQLIDDFGSTAVYEGGLHIYTTIDMEMQRAAERAVAEILDEDYPITDEDDYPQAAVVVLDPNTGEIKALVGGRTHTSRLELNRATQSYRQPGSAFKPIVPFAAAIDMGFTAATVVDDAPVQYRQWDDSIWAPMNHDRQFRGLMPLRDALARSINVIAVRMLDRIGVSTGIEYAERLGITSLVREGPINDLNLAIALGGVTDGVSPLEMTSAFGVFATDGVRVSPFAITRVEDNNRLVIYQTDPELEVVLNPGTGYLITDMLRTAVESGTGTRARIPDHVIAGKTGTTSDHVDAWFVGYTPELVCGVWMGHDQPKRMENVWGGTYPTLIFQTAMAQILENREPVDFTPPSGIISGLTICTKSGLRVGSNCPPEHHRQEIFLRGTQPTQECNVHIKVDICSESGLLATEHCPHDAIAGQVFIRRSEPFVPYTDERGRTYIPADAVNEAPEDSCDVCSLPDDPFHTDPDYDDDDTYEPWHPYEPDDPDEENEHDHLDETTDEQAEQVESVSTVVFDIKARQYYFDPGHIQVPAGTLVVINLTSEAVRHGLTIPSLGVELIADAGQTQTIEFMVETPGVYQFWCPVECGRHCNRMVGQLVVTD